MTSAQSLVYNNYYDDLAHPFPIAGKLPLHMHPPTHPHTHTHTHTLYHLVRQCMWQYSVCGVVGGSGRIEFNCHVPGIKISSLYNSVFKRFH